MIYMYNCNSSKLLNYSYICVSITGISIQKKAWPTISTKRVNLNRSFFIAKAGGRAGRQAF